MVIKLSKNLIFDATKFRKKVECMFHITIKIESTERKERKMRKPNNNNITSYNNSLEL